MSPGSPPSAPPTALESIRWAVGSLPAIPLALALATALHTANVLNVFAAVAELVPIRDSIVAVPVLAVTTLLGVVLVIALASTAASDVLSGHDYDTRDRLSSIRPHLSRVAAFVFWCYLLFIAATFAVLLVVIPVGGPFFPWWASAGVIVAVNGYLLLRVALAVPAVVVDEQHPVDALQHGWRASKGHERQLSGPVSLVGAAALLPEVVAAQSGLGALTLLLVAPPVLVCLGLLSATHVWYGIQNGAGE